jgi:acyl carrier protein
MRRTVVFEDFSAARLSKAEVASAVKRVLVLEARSNLDPETLADDEPLNSELLRITSMSFIGVILSLEEELNITLEDELFMKTTFTTVGDVVGLIERVYHDQHQEGV